MPLLFSKNFVSGEAYSFLAMVSGIMNGLPLPTVVSNANREYQAFQRHHGNRAGRPFIAPAKLRFPKNSWDK